MVIKYKSTAQYSASCELHRRSNFPELFNNDKVQIAQVRKTMEIYFLEMTQMWERSKLK